MGGVNGLGVERPASLDAPKFPGGAALYINKQDRTKSLRYAM